MPIDFWQQVVIEYAIEIKIIHKFYGGRMGSDSLEVKGNLPLEFIDCGCQVHKPSKLKIAGSEASIRITDIIRNLPRDGEFPTYICKHGHVHRLSVKSIKGCQVTPEERRSDFRDLGKRTGI